QYPSTCFDSFQITLVSFVLLLCSATAFTQIYPLSLHDALPISASARICCPTPFVLNRPPCPRRRSIFTCSLFRRISRPTRIAPRQVYRFVLMKLARLNLLSGERTNRGRPSSNPVICSPEK